MQSPYKPKYEDYAPILDRLNMPYQVIGSRLVVGEFSMSNNWIIFISVLMAQIEEVTEKTLPLLALKNLPFAMIRNQFYHHQLNSGILGETEIGKVIIVCCEDFEQAITAKNMLLPALEGFDGPCIQGTLQVSGTLSMCYSKMNEGMHNLTISVPSKLASTIALNKKIKSRQARKSIIANSYVAYKLLSESTKTSIYQGIIIKKLKLDWCLIKKGKPFMGEDANGRTIKERLLWEKTALNRLHPYLPCPVPLDFIEQHSNYYLLLNYIEGVPLHMVVTRLKKGTYWFELDHEIQKQLLGYYLQILDMVERLHQLNFIHRDIKESNFIISSTGKVSIIDFELSYDMSSNQPAPAYIMGTPGYVCPEQLEYAQPTPMEDIFSLGALLAYILTGEYPNHFFSEGMIMSIEKLTHQTRNRELSNLVDKCMASTPNSRPTIPQIRGPVERTIYEIRLIVRDHAIFKPTI